MQAIDNFLDKITMYRLVLYYLLLLFLVAVIYAFLGILNFNAWSLVASLVILTVSCWFTNQLFAKVFRAAANVESVYISALILALIITPAKSLSEVIFLIFAGVLAMSSKYILALKSKHLFNPVAIAVALTSLVGIGSASWWIGTGAMVPYLLLGWLIVRKIRRSSLIWSFFLAVAITMLSFSLWQGSNLLTTLHYALFSSSLLFFAFLMLTEPLTTPPTHTLQIVYGGLVGVLFSPQFHLGSFYTTPELALVIGNIFSYLVSPKSKLIATLEQKIQTATGMFDFIFTANQKLDFQPGQYLEWTLPHSKSDSRGNRRYFTIASSPTEANLRLGVRIGERASSFKQALLKMNSAGQIVGAQLSGDFTLPKDPKQKLVFIAGGIGITPFRSMLKYLIDTKQTRPVTLFYSNKTADQIMYADVFTQAERELGIKTIYTLTDLAKILPTWQGERGRLNAGMMRATVPDFRECLFYLSGPHSLVVGFEQVLKQLGIAKRQIKQDFFPGLV